MPTSLNTLAVGVFDSGVGGISVLKHIHTLLPNERLLYFADSLHAPYGSKTADQIRQRAYFLSDWLVTRGVKAIVVACNTATAAAVQGLREKYTLPIIGMEPAVKPAAAASHNGVIGVLATSGTLQSAQFAALLESYGRNVQVITQACVGLVECIERGELETPATHDLLLRYLSPLLEAKADTIVLGCTHYPFVRPMIERILEQAYRQGVCGKINLIDTGDAVARHLRTRLAQANMLAPQRHVSQHALHDSPQLEFWTNSSRADAEATMRKLWGSAISVSRVR